MLRVLPLSHNHRSTILWKNTLSTQWKKERHIMCEQCNENEPNVTIGERVIAVADIDAKRNIIKVFGKGTYEGQHVPHWVDLDLLLKTVPNDLREVAQKIAEEMLEKLSDPETPQRLSNTALGMGMSPTKAAEMLDEFYEEQKKYAGLSVEQAAIQYLREMLAKQLKSPRIRLDSGECVYGVHCIFGQEKKMQDAIDQTVAELAQKGVNVNVETIPVPEHADA